MRRGVDGDDVCLVTCLCARRLVRQHSEGMGGDHGNRPSPGSGPGTGMLRPGLARR